MSIKSKLLAAGLAVGVAGGITVAGPLTGTLAANAASDQCGSACIDIFSAAYGTHQDPGEILNVLDEKTRAGQPILLDTATDGYYGEDFETATLEPVSTYAQFGVISATLAARYSHDMAFEILYAPGGNRTELCVGTAATPGAGTPVTLRSCGVDARTVWIIDPVVDSYVALISGATGTRSAHPYALTENGVGQQLSTTPLVTSLRSRALAHQLWGAVKGVVSSPVLP